MVWCGVVWCVRVCVCACVRVRACVRACGVVWYGVVWCGVGWGVGCSGDGSGGGNYLTIDYHG